MNGSKTHETCIMSRYLVTQILPPVLIQQFTLTQPRKVPLYEFLVHAIQLPISIHERGATNGRTYYGSSPGLAGRSLIPDINPHRRPPQSIYAFASLLWSMGAVDTSSRGVLSTFQTVHTHGSRESARSCAGEAIASTGRRSAQVYLSPIARTPEIPPKPVRANVLAVSSRNVNPLLSYLR